MNLFKSMRRSSSGKKQNFNSGVESDQANLVVDKTSRNESGSSETSYSTKSDHHVVDVNNDVAAQRDPLVVCDSSRTPTLSSCRSKKNLISEFAATTKEMCGKVPSEFSDNNMNKNIIKIEPPVIHTSQQDTQNLYDRFANQSYSKSDSFGYNAACLAATNSAAKLQRKTSLIDADDKLSNIDANIHALKLIISSLEGSLVAFEIQRETIVLETLEKKANIARTEDAFASGEIYIYETEDHLDGFESTTRFVEPSSPTWNGLTRASL